MEKLRKIKIKVTHQGAPIVNAPHGWVEYESDKVILVTIDCRTKYPSLDFFGSSGENIPFSFYLSANKNSLYLTEGMDIEEPTRVEIPELIEWTGRSARVCKSRIYLTLTKNL